MVGGVECRTVFIEGKGVVGDPMIEWLIGTKDSIPRGIRRIYKECQSMRIDTSQLNEQILAYLSESEKRLLERMRNRRQ